MVNQCITQVLDYKEYWNHNCIYYFVIPHKRFLDLLSIHAGRNNDKTDIIYIWKYCMYCKQLLTWRSVNPIWLIVYSACIYDAQITVYSLIISCISLLVPRPINILLLLFDEQTLTVDRRRTWFKKYYCSILSCFVVE